MTFLSLTRASRRYRSDPRDGYEAPRHAPLSLRYLLGNLMDAKFPLLELAEDAIYTGVWQRLGRWYSFDQQGAR